MSTKTFTKTTQDTAFEVGGVYEFRLVNAGMTQKAFTAVKAAFKTSHGIGSPLSFSRYGKWGGKKTVVFVEMTKTEKGFEPSTDDEGKMLKPIHISIEDLQLGMYVELEGGNFDLPLECRLIQAATKKDNAKDNAKNSTKKDSTAAKKDSTKKTLSAAKKDSTKDETAVKGDKGVKKS